MLVRRRTCVLRRLGAFGDLLSCFTELIAEGAEGFVAGGLGRTGRISGSSEGQHGR